MTTVINELGPMTDATKETVVMIEVMYEEGRRGLVDEHWRPSVKAPPLAAGGPVAAGAVMTADEAAMLMAGAAHFYVIQEIKFGHEDTTGSIV